VIGTVIVGIGVLVALEILELTALVGAVFGAAGAAGIILGFAFRDIIENYLASIILSVRRPFSTKDHVLIDSHEGKVLRLTSRDTILMTLEGNHLRLPNSVVFRAKILNYTRNPLRRFDFSVGLGVDEDISGAIRLGQSTLDSTPGVCTVPPPFARVEELGESNVALRYFCWVDQREADWFKVRSEAIRRTKVALDTAGVDMPVPIYQVNLNRPSLTREKKAPVDPLEKEAHEVTVDAYLEEQIANDQQISGDEDLLKASPSSDD
jgi:small-conductance mechanosensitive channel